MFRGIGLSLLVMCACALLQGATLFAGITNGSFNDPVNGWDYGWTIDGDVYEGTVLGHPNSAWLPESEGLTNSLSQIFSIAPGELSLRFDLTFEFGEFTETDYFKAFLLKSDGSPIDGLTVNPDGSFYWMNTKSVERELFPSQVVVVNQGDMFPDTDDLFRSIRSITIPILSGWGDAMIRFELVGEEELFPETNVLAAAFVSNVSTTTVPEPATMTLGVIGVGVVGMLRRRMR